MAYTQPTAADLKMRFPVFANVADATVDYWLADARLIVSASWIEEDRAPAEMALAAHSMARLKVPGMATDAIGDVAAAGVTDFKSASMSVSFDSGAAARRSGTGYASTDYGALFEPYLRRNTGGPFLAGACG